MDRARAGPAVLLLMGVSGAGKTTNGGALAARLGWAFVEADRFHPPANIAKMRAGIPLDDADRAPWLDAARAGIERRVRNGENVIVACSVLRRSYRGRLLGGLPRVAIVWLRAPRTVLHDRIAGRADHYMPATLLDSQLATLEPPAALGPEEPLRLGPWNDTALVVDAGEPVQRIVEIILKRLDAS